VRSERCFGKAGGCSDLVWRCSDTGQQQETVVSECGRARSGVELLMCAAAGKCEEVAFGSCLPFARGLAFDGLEDTASHLKRAWRRGGGSSRVGGGNATGY